MTADESSTDAGIAALQDLDDHTAARQVLRDVPYESRDELVVVRGPQGQEQRAAKPYGLREDAAGRPRIQVVAPIRVTTPLAKLPEVVAVIAAWKRRMVLMICAAAAAGALASFVFTWIRQIPQQAAPPIPVAAANVPCLVARLTDRDVACKVGAAEVVVAPGQFFPDGAVRLESVDREANRFVVMHMPSHTRVSFQVDSRALAGTLVEITPK